MSSGRTDEFRKEAVRIALTSGLSRRQVADDMGVGFSTLNKRGERAAWYGCGLCRGPQACTGE